MEYAEFKSNITISSNVYLRKTIDGVSVSLEDDPDFVSNVTGKIALGETDKRCKSTYKKGKLSNTQLLELQEGASCYYDKLGEETFGPVMVNGERIWACRCENIDCSRYESCMNHNYAKRINRINQDDDITVIYKTENNLTFKSLEIDFSQEGQDEKLFHPIPNNPITPKFEHDIKNELLLDNTIELPHDYVKINDPSLIVQSTIDENILVNAGPGTGKTHTVIERLEYIAINNLVDDLSNVLVLCYTKSAEFVINQRLEQGVIEGRLQPEVQSICILTFDSFATKYLDLIEEEYINLSYNQRIALFNKKINPIDFEDFEYVIIDEIQDLVNERGNMTLNIITCLKCSYLLLGDKCQAIYDYESCLEEQMNSVEFYSALESLFKNTGKKYEFYKNRRQNTTLAEYSTSIRKSLLNSTPKEVVTFINNQKKLLPILGTEFYDTLRQNSNTIAILCRSNGQAELISNNLHRKGIDHLLLRQNQRKILYHRWIADMFWDFSNDYIKKEDFIQRYYIRVKENLTEAEKYFQILRDFTIGDENNQLPGIEKTKLLKALRISIDPSKELLVNSNINLTVSTIHKAKGKEFDIVYLVDFLLDENCETTEEARVAYVAVTRSKENLHLLTSNVANGCFDKSKSQRTFAKNFKAQKYPFCSKIALGYDCDLNTNSFLTSSLSKSVFIQEYIATKVNVHDPITLKLDDNMYKVIHSEYEEDVVLGELTQSVVEQILECVLIKKDSNLPPFLHSLYISNIVTCYQDNISSNMPSQFKESAIWLGIEISGFAKINWHYGE